MESKKDGLTGLSFLTRDGFIGQGNQIGNNWISKMNEKELKIGEGKLRILQHIWKRELEWLLIKRN